MTRIDGSGGIARGGWLSCPRSLGQLERHACQDHPRLEEQQPLQVERALVVQQPVGAADDELGHYNHGDSIWVGRDGSQVCQQRRADVSERRLDDLQRQPGWEAAPIVFDRAHFVVVLGEVDRPRASDPERARVQQGPQRGSVDAGDGDHDLGPLRKDIVLTELGDVGDGDARLP